MLMHKYIQPEFFHRFACLIYGLDKQLDKLEEEVKELRQALLERNIEHIEEEMADVEVCLPYFYLKFNHTKKQRVIEYSGRDDDPLTYIELWLHLFSFYKNDKTNNSIIYILDIATDMLCEAMFTIYNEYNLDMYKISEIRDQKKQRTVRRIIKK